MCGCVGAAAPIQLGQAAGATMGAGAAASPPKDSAATAGVAQLNQALPASGPTQAGGAFKAGGSDWKQVPGRASDSPKAQRAFAVLQDLISRYPTPQALEAAGIKLAPGSTNHYEVKQRNFYDDGETHLAHLIVENGRVTGAQFDSNARQLSSPVPEGWSGVQWHYHDHNKASWMFHVDGTKPIDAAFIEKHQH